MRLRTVCSNTSKGGLLQVKLSFKDHYILLAILAAAIPFLELCVLAGLVTLELIGIIPKGFALKFLEVYALGALALVVVPLVLIMLGALLWYEMLPDVKSGLKTRTVDN